MLHFRSLQWQIAGSEFGVEGRCFTPEIEPESTTGKNTSQAGMIPENLKQQ
jgi:hypothetical protein